KPGDNFSYVSFDHFVNLALRTEVTVKDVEEVELFGGPTRKKLLRIEQRPEKLPGLQLPMQTVWLDGEGKTVRQQYEIPGIGQLTLYRTTKDNALAPGAGASLTDVGLTTTIKLNKRIVKPHETTAAIYRVTVKDTEDVESTFSRDARQLVKATNGQTF